MTEQTTSIFQDGVDRFHAARERIDEEFQRVQKQLSTRRRRLERQLESRRKNLERQTRKQVEQIRSNSLVRRAEEFWTEAGTQAENAIERVLGTLQIASKGDVQRIDRKLSKINKKLKEIERSRGTNGRQPPAHA